MSADRRIVGLALLVLAASTAGMLAGVEPFASWYYLFAWYPTIAIADAWGHARDPQRPMLLANPAVLGSLLGWSAAIWLSFELWNLRLENWYYVNVIDQRALRWTGTALAFATVLPGLFAIAKLLAAYGVGEGARGASIRMTPRRLRFLTAASLASAALVLLWPRYFFPLVWGVLFFLAAPFNYRRGRYGILRQLESGQWGPTIRLLISGAVCGFLWELFNSRARTKWIYTVPGFEELKLFEMPMLGFFGFPPFALECYEMYRAAVHLGVAADWEDGDGMAPPHRAAGHPAARHRAAGLKVAAAFALAAMSILALMLMDRATIDSTTPRPSDLPAVDSALAERLEASGVRDVHRVRDLLVTHAGRERLGITKEASAVLADQVDLALLKGIGSRQAAKLVAAGISNVEELARVEVEELARRLQSVAPGDRVRRARLGVWIRAARAQARPSARE